MSTALVMAFTSLSSAAPLFIVQKAFAAGSGDVWIMAAMPNPSSGGTEYVTLKNTSSGSISLNNWSVVTTSSHLITTSKILAAGGEVTICDNPAKDAKCDAGYSVGLVLPNSDTSISLRDSASPSNLIDQVSYTGSQITAKGQEVQFHAISYHPTVTPQEFTTISDTAHYYKGIDVGFTLNNDFGTLTDITVKLYSGSTLIGTNTAAQPMLDYYNNGGRGFTTPFVIQKGAYDPATDTYWTFSSYNWDKQNTPTKVVISATGSNGSDTKENDALALGGGSFDSLFPADTTAPHIPMLSSPGDGAVLSNHNGPDFAFTWDTVSDSSLPVTYDWESSYSNTTDGTNGGFTDVLAHHEGLTDASLLEGNAAEGTYYWQVRACDGAGNCSNWSAPWKVTIDNTGPTITIATPQSGQYVNTSQNNWSLSATGSVTDSNLSYYYCYITSNTTGNEVGTRDALCNTNWGQVTNGTLGTINNLNNLPDGGYTFNVAAHDKAGNITTAAQSFTLDNTKPTVTFTDPASYPAANGYYNSDFQVKWAAHDNDQLRSVNVSLFDTDPTHSNHWVATCYSNSAETTTDDAGTCTVKLPAGLPDGQYYVQVGAQDAAGNWSVNAVRNLTIDHTAPAAFTLTGPAPVENAFENTTDFNFTWEPSSDANGVTYKICRSQIAPANGVVRCDWVWTIRQADIDQNGTQFPFNNTFVGNNGNYTWYWQVSATDSAGNTTLSNIGKVTIDTTAPVVSLSSPADGSLLQGNLNPIVGSVQDDNLFGSAVFLVSGTVSDDLNDVSAAIPSGDMLSLDLSGASFQDKDLGNLDTTAHPDGAYTLVLAAVDLADNIGWDLSYVTIDNTAPVVHITAPIDSVIHGTVTISGTVTDAHPDHYYLVVEDAQGHVVTGPGTVYAAAVADYGWDTTKLHDGTYTIDLEARDQAGNKGADSVATMQVTVDNSAPAGLANFAPANGTYTTTSKLTSIDWTDANDAHGPITYYYESSSSPATNADGSFTSPAYQSGALGSSQISTANTPAGTYYWHVRAVDALGNSTDWTDAWKVTVDNTAPADPVLVIPDNGIVVNGKSITQSWSDSSNDVDHYVYESYNDANATSLRYRGTYAATSKTATNVSESTYWWRVMAVDKAGNESGWSPLWKITVDNTAPAMAITAASQSSLNAVTFEGYMNDANFDYYYCWLTKKGDSTEITGTRGSNCVTTWAKNLQKNGNPATSTAEGDGSLASPVTLGNFDVTGLTSGSYTVNLVGYDLAGNNNAANPATADVTIDHTAPTLTINPSTGTDTTPALTGTIDDPSAAITITIDGGASQAAVNNGNGTWLFTVTSPLAIGTHNVTAVATDAAGNAFQDTATITVDSTPAPTPQNPGNTTTTVTVTPAADGGHVLGAQTTTNNNTGGNNTADDSTAKNTTMSDQNSAFLGLGWWWLAVLALLVGLFLFVLLRRSSSDEQA